MPQASHQNAIEFLRTQHEAVRQMLAAVDEATGEARAELFAPLVRLLAVHETAEEMVVYPAIRTTGGDDGDRIARARMEEEDQSKKMLAELEGTDPSSPEFSQRFTSFRAAVEAHAEAEEREVFPLLGRTTDERQLAAMAAALDVAERIAPTHAHRAAPESALGNLLVGPMVSMVDRVRDAIRDATR